MFGFIVSIFLLTYLLFERFILRKYIWVYVISIIDMLIGAKSFGFLCKLLVNYTLTGIWKWEESFFNSGIVYLGGLLGYLAMLRILCCFKERNWLEISDITAVVIPLFHAFGRVGCFLAGCCYGKESYSIISIPYRTVLEDEIGSNRIPVQLMEATFELLVFIILFCIYKKMYANNRLNGILMLAYLSVYSIWRLIIELFRGDEMRGVFLGISFSQIISLMILICCVLIYLKFRRKYK
jgi:phosphatidylglycerol:prolipoprotein diacylglycerol transferase